jgi:hypothetical protein
LKYQEIQLLTNIDIETILKKKHSFVLLVKNIENKLEIEKQSKIYKHIHKINFLNYYFILEKNINSEFKLNILDNIIPSYLIIKNKKIIEIGPIDY